jgi:Ca-activated chloride channel family protein
VSFEQPLGLLGLLSLPLFLLVGWLGLRHGRVRAVRYSNLEVLLAVAAGERSRRGWLPVVLSLGALGCLSVALARPVLIAARVVPGAVVVLVFDVSGSMASQDIKPTRLGAAEHAALVFIQRLPARTAVGIVAFSSGVQVLAPPTTDRRLLTSAIGTLSPGGATAIGDGLARAIQLIDEASRGGNRRSRLRRSSTHRRPPGRVLLLSDGAYNWGLISPLQAAGQAHRLRIPVDTIGLGSRDGGVEVNGELYTGPGLTPDLVTLARIARLTGGRSFAVTNSTRLTDTYRRLAATISQRATRREQAAVAFLATAILLVTVGGLLTQIQRPRLP